MRPQLLLVSLLLFSLSVFAQDVKVRQEAIQLLERATAASTSPNLPNLERVDTFRVFDSDSPAQEGNFSRVVVQGTGRRDEVNLGSYHLVNIFTHGQVAIEGSSQIVPPSLEDVARLTPINLVSFDAEDIIHEIVDREAGGRVVRCIEFDTIRGQKTDGNEICVGSDNGVLVSMKVGNELIENSDFFPFAGALMPGKISYSVGGKIRLEISQTMTELVDATPNVLAPPPNANILKMCTTFRRAIGISMPQPKQGGLDSDYEVVVRGDVGEDGKVHQAVVQESERPELNAEALSIAQSWVFTPARCDGKPYTTEVNLSLHFQGR
ncbi:MAG TPA: energy transducer TonB [Terriglobia bacterium]|nr:energy transducer TonB [Terriglobia bacterium]